MHGLTIHFIWECQNCDKIMCQEYKSAQDVQQNWVFPMGWSKYDADVFCNECWMGKQNG